MKTSITNFSKLLLVAIILFTVTAITSCKKKNEESAIPLIETQNPLAGYLAATGFNQTVRPVNDADYEFGISFKPLVNGKMTALVVKIPTVNPSLRVTIWDKTTATALRTELVAVTSSGVEVTKEISPLELIKDKQYFISFRSNNYYRHEKTNKTNATYPVIVGDISINSYAYGEGAIQEMPNIIMNNYYAGDCSFKFQK